MSNWYLVQAAVRYLRLWNSDHSFQCSSGVPLSGSVGLDEGPLLTDRFRSN